jgi:hypothetical protein
MCFTAFSKYLNINVSEIEIEKYKILQQLSPQYFLIESLYNFLFKLEIQCNTIQCNTQAQNVTSFNHNHMYGINYYYCRSIYLGVM